MANKAKKTAEAVDPNLSFLLENGYTSEQLAKMSPEAVSQLAETIKVSQTIMDNTAGGAEIVPQLSEGPTAGPKCTENGWTEYVMSLLTDDEKDNKQPKTDGLRRVAELLMGPFDIITNIVQSPTIENGGRATVCVSLTFRSDNRTICGSADVFGGNTASTYAVHPVATAETRAEGRALRRALRLVKVLAAEETYNADADAADGSDKRVVSGTLNAILVMADKIKVDPMKLAVKMGYPINTPSELTQKQALNIANQLSKYHRKEDDVPNEVRR